MQSFLVSHAIYAIIVFGVLEAMCIPISSELTFLLGGAIASGGVAGTQQHPSLVLVIVLGTLAELVGSYISYYVGRVGGKPLVHRWGRYVLVTEADVARAERFLVGRGVWAVPVARMLPFVRAFASIVAGFVDIPPVRFGVLGQAAGTLTDTARETVEALGRGWVEPEQRTGTVTSAREGGWLLGLFSGGTLCDEAMILVSAGLGPVMSNIPLRPEWSLDDALQPPRQPCHSMVDLGDDRLTRGRPHPMIDQTIRVERLLRAVDEPTTGVLLLDVVLGLGAAADPAGELVEPVRKATAAGVPVLVSVVGTRDDPQGLRRQLDTLHDAGAWVFGSNAAAARHAVRLLDTEEARR